MQNQRIGGQLMESAPRPSRGARPVIVSIATHASLIAGSIAATLHPTARIDTAQEPVAVVDLSKFAPPSPSQFRAREATIARLPARGFQILVAPLDAPVVLPTVDVSQPVALPEDFSGRGVAGGLASGVGASLLAPTAASNDPIDGSAADEPPYMLPGQMGPSYPDPLRDDRPDGFVIVRFVIDTLGRVEPPSLHVLHASHPLFLDAVRASLDRIRFLPGTYSGQRVRVRMEQRFEFHLASP